MRLIDADATVEKLKEYVTEMENDIYYGSNLGIPEDCICEAIEEVPTIEAEPVRHGKWIESYCNLVCSCCKWEYSDELPFMSNQGIDKMSESFAYCPHCGAKMDGGAENA